MWFSALKTLAVPYLGWIKAAGVVILIGLAIYQVRAYNERIRAETRVELKAKYDEGYADALANARAKEASDRQMWQTRSQSYEDQLNALRNAPTVPAPRVVCRGAPASNSMRGSPTIASQLGETNPAQLGGENAHPAERDIGPALIEYATRVEEMAIQCAEIQRGYLELTGVHR